MKDVPALKSTSLTTTEQTTTLTVSVWNGVKSEDGMYDTAQIMQIVKEQTTDLLTRLPPALS